MCLLICNDIHKLYGVSFGILFLCTFSLLYTVHMIRTSTHVYINKALFECVLDGLYFSRLSTPVGGFFGAMSIPLLDITL